MTSGDVKLAACPTCRYHPVSVNATACPKCGEPITASTKSAMIQGVEEQRERAAREAEERRAFQAREAEKLRELSERNRKIAEFEKRLLKCNHCGGSFPPYSGHHHMTPQGLVGVEFEPFSEVEEIYRTLGWKCDKCGVYDLHPGTHNRYMHPSPTVEKAWRPPSGFGGNF